MTTIQYFDGEGINCDLAIWDELVEEKADFVDKTNSYRKSFSYLKYSYL